MDIIKLRWGIIVACDVPGLEQLSSLVRATCKIDCIVGYKVGMLLALSNGLTSATTSVKKHTDKPVIYDHQKFGTDIPEVCSGEVLDQIKSAGIEGLIMFPHAGIETLKAALRGCKEREICPIIGGEMTHKGYLQNEGGYISNDAPRRMYADAAQEGARYFVVPGTKTDQIKIYSELLGGIVSDPVFMFPGIGKGQGGDIVDAFEATAPYRAYAIVGRSIYQSSDPRGAAEQLWQTVVASGFIDL